MDKQIFYAKNLNDVFSILKNNPGVKIIGGSTRIEEFPDKAISTRNVKDLCQIVRHERYLDVGPGVSLAEMLEIGEKHLPPVLFQALSCISNPFIRNLATLGGNICAEGQKLTLYAPLIALDARLEFSSPNETFSESIKNFKNIPNGFVLTNIRIPLNDVDLTIFRRIGPEHKITEDSASYAFMASIEKNSLMNVEIAFAGPFTFSSNSLEDSLIGRHLPFSQKDIQEIEEIVQSEFSKAATDQMITDELRQQFLNLVRYSLEQLT